MTFYSVMAFNFDDFVEKVLVDQIRVQIDIHLRPSLLFFQRFFLSIDFASILLEQIKDTTFAFAAIQFFAFALNFSYPISIFFPFPFASFPIVSFALHIYAALLAFSGPFP